MGRKSVKLIEMNSLISISYECPEPALHTHPTPPWLAAAVRFGRRLIFCFVEKERHPRPGRRASLDDYGHQNCNYSVYVQEAQLEEFVAAVHDLVESADRSASFWNEALALATRAGNI